MKVKIIIPDIGPARVTLEIKDEIPQEKQDAWLKSINEKMDCVFRQTPILLQNKEIRNLPRPVSMSAESAKEIPATPKALKAFELAARTNHTTVPEVCKQYGVDSDNISKQACYQMTSELNDKSGYSNLQQQHKK